MKIIVKNKRAYYDYFLKEKFEAGIVLCGTEVKSLRIGKVSLKESHVIIDAKGEMWAVQLLIPQYLFGNQNNHRETRRKKLLLHKKEIKYIDHLINTQRLSLIPTLMYFKNSLVKLEISLGQGKKLYDKRESEAKRDVERKLRNKIFE